MKELSRRDCLVGIVASWLAKSRAADAAPATSPPLWLAQRGAAKLYFFGQLPVRTDSTWQSPQVLQAFETSTEFWTENPDPAAGAPTPRKPSGPKLLESVKPD